MDSTPTLFRTAAQYQCVSAIRLPVGDSPIGPRAFTRGVLFRFFGDGGGLIIAIARRIRCFSSEKYFLSLILDDDGEPGVDWGWTGGLLGAE